IIRHQLCANSQFARVARKWRKKAFDRKNNVAKEKLPSSLFIGEESTAAGSTCLLTDDPTWIIDPIDGTCNFVHRFPTVAVSIGFAVNQELEFGVIYHCTEEKMYTGRRGHGAFCNQERLQVTKQTDIRNALIVTEIGPKRDPATLKLFLKYLLIGSLITHRVRVIGSATLALCHIAAGTADAFYQYGLHCWDLAAATVIIREAGGVVIDTTGTSFLNHHRAVAVQGKAVKPGKCMPGKNPSRSRSHAAQPPEKADTVEGSE
uniref:Inositol-1-monophosphatase n=1 Tax=Leptobrachium leishanense TaxID=445787 RepID=A0A8C5QQZ5_9ANUR